MWPARVPPAGKAEGASSGKVGAPAGSAWKRPRFEGRRRDRQTEGLGETTAAISGLELRDLALRSCAVARGGGSAGASGGGDGGGL